MCSQAVPLPSLAPLRRGCGAELRLMGSPFGTDMQSIGAVLQYFVAKRGKKAVATNNK
jgi:hypothetical protein